MCKRNSLKVNVCYFVLILTSNVYNKFAIAKYIRPISNYKLLNTFVCLKM